MNSATNAVDGIANLSNVDCNMGGTAY